MGGGRVRGRGDGASDATGRQTADTAEVRPAARWKGHAAVIAWLRHILRLDFEPGLKPEARRKAEQIETQQRRARRNVERTAAVVEAYGMIGQHRRRKR